MSHALQRLLTASLLGVTLAAMGLLVSVSGVGAQTAPPTVTTVSPASGTAAGGTEVTIIGTGFAAGTAVTFNGEDAADVDVESSTKLVVTTPAGTAGPVTIRVQTANGETTVTGAFAYLGPAPTVTAIAPNEGPTTGGTSVTITGTGFQSGATVKIGGVAATNVTVDSATKITARTAARAAGTVAVDVTNADGQAGTLSNAFTYKAAPAPAVTSVSPNSGPTGGGTVVTVTGTGFTSGAAVRFGATAATNVTVNSSTKITATAPARSSAGAVSVVVTNSDNQQGQLTNGFTYVPTPAPTVTSVSPSSGTTGGGTVVTITGTGLANGAVVRFGGTQASSVTVNSSTKITATVPARSSTGAVSVTVTNPDGQQGQRSNGYTYVSTPAPDINTIAPNSGPTTGGAAVSIKGTGFLAGATVAFGTNNSPSVTIVSSTEIVAIAPARSSTGAVSVRVTNTDGKSDTRSSGYTYVGAPTITSISPTSGSTAGNTEVVINGTNFTSGMIVTFGGSTATNVTVNSSTKLTVRTPAREAGVVSVQVFSPAGQQATLANAFTFRSPAHISSVTPSSGPTSGGTQITILGSGFTSGSTVTISGTPATNVVVVSSTQITARTPVRTAGTAVVAVKSADGVEASGVAAFTYTAAPAAGSIVSGSIPTSGAGLFVFAGGTNEQLTAAAVSAGCAANRVGFFATSGGAFIIYLPQAPAFVNNPWNALFPSGIPANTPLVAVCR